MSHIHDSHTPMRHADLDVYRLIIQGPALHLLYRTLSDQIRPNKGKIRNMSAGGGRLSFDIALTEDELTFVKLCHPEVQAVWLQPYEVEHK